MWQIEILELDLDWLIMFKQTIRRHVKLEGFRPFSGGRGILSLYPSRQGYISINGIKVEPKAIIKQNGEHTTIISDGKKKVKGVEHILSAIYGKGYHSIKVQTDSDEIPFVDGSALGYSRLLDKAGKMKIKSSVKEFRLDREVFFSYKNSLAIIRPAKKLKVSCLIQFPEPIGEQYFVYNGDYKEVEFARTFIRSECSRKVWKYVRSLFTFLSPDMKKSPINMFRNGKWINKLRRKDECARHKMLDFLGDISLLGKQITGNITLIRPGHEFNRELAKFLSKIK